MALYEFRDHEGIRDIQQEVVYAILNTSGKIVYVGKTTDPLYRFVAHRKRFGRGIAMKFIQVEFSGESPAHAEAKWIRRLVQHGCPLTNQTYIRPDGSDTEPPDLPDNCGDRRDLQAKLRKGQVLVGKYTSHVKLRSGRSWRGANSSRHIMSTTHLRGDTGVYPTE
jgi:GIY-YIG catalytic domain